LAASFFAATSLAGFSPAIGISIFFCPAAALRAFLAGFFRRLRRGRRASSDALAQRVHQVDDVLAAGTRFRGGRFCVLAAAGLGPLARECWTGET
jgi:hypothetical protein